MGHPKFSQEDFLSAALAVDFAHLSLHIVGHDTVIDLGRDASITLTGIVAPFTSHDILIG